MGKPQQATYDSEPPRGYKQTHQHRQHAHMAAQSRGGGWRELGNIKQIISFSSHGHRLHWIHDIEMVMTRYRCTTKSCVTVTSLTSLLLCRWEHLHGEWYWFKSIIFSNAKTQLKIILVNTLGFKDSNAIYNVQPEIDMDLGSHMVGHPCFPQFPGTGFLSLSIGYLDINWQYIYLHTQNDLCRAGSRAGEREAQSTKDTTWPAPSLSAHSAHQRERWTCRIESSGFCPWGSCSRNVKAKNVTEQTEGFISHTVQGYNKHNYFTVMFNLRFTSGWTCATWITCFSFVLRSLNTINWIHFAISRRKQHSVFTRTWGDE